MRPVIALLIPVLICGCINSTYEKTATTIITTATTTTTTQKITSMCSDISENNLRYECYKQSAVEKNDLTICDSIEDPDAQYVCRATVRAANRPTLTTSLGFPKIKPKLSDTKMHSTGSLDLSFVSGVGVAIQVKEIRVSEDEQLKCRKTTSMDVAPGDPFEITMDGCGEKKAGDIRNLKIDIYYTLTYLDGITRPYNESGTIRGEVD